MEGEGKADTRLAALRAPPRPIQRGAQVVQLHDHFRQGLGLAGGADPRRPLLGELQEERRVALAELLCRSACEQHTHARVPA